MRYLTCRKHSQTTSDVWVICTHFEKISVARRVVDDVVQGEAVCATCREALNRAEPAKATLRLACGACVRERWPIEGAD